MSDIDGREKFLREGIARYADAIDTLQAFEELVIKRLSEIIKEAEMDGFEPVVDCPIESKDARGSGWGYAIYAARKGKLRRQGTVWLEIGIWWKHRDPLIGGVPALYADFLDEEDKPLSFEYHGTAPGVRFVRWGKGPRLFYAPAADVSLDEGLARLLKALADCFK